MIVYENHVMSNPRLPFIFNVTTLVPNGTPVWKGAGNWHENIEIIYIKSGSGFIVIGDRYIPASKGDIIPISSGRLHGMFVSECEMTYYYLIIDRNFFLSNHFDSNNFVSSVPKAVVSFLSIRRFVVYKQHIILFACYVCDHPMFTRALVYMPDDLGFCLLTFEFCLAACPEL